MIQQSLDNPTVATFANKLANALLKQEQFFLENYTNATHHPDYLVLTKKVNDASQQLADVLQSFSIPLAFTHKITLVDDSMDLAFLVDAMQSQFGNHVALESKTASQLVLYTDGDHASAVKVSLYEANKQIGMISCFNVAQRTNKPYIVGLHTWQEARQLKQALSDANINMTL